MKILVFLDEIFYLIFREVEKTEQLAVLTLVCSRSHQTVFGYQKSLCFLFFNCSQIRVLLHL